MRSLWLKNPRQRRNLRRLAGRRAECHFGAARGHEDGGKNQKHQAEKKSPIISPSQVFPATTTMAGPSCLFNCCVRTRHFLGDYFLQLRLKRLERLARTAIAPSCCFDAATGEV